jgi:hypothetical protein
MNELATFAVRAPTHTNRRVRVSGSTTVRETCGMFARRLQLPLLSDAYELRQITPQGGTTSNLSTLTRFVATPMLGRFALFISFTLYSVLFL